MIKHSVLSTKLQRRVKRLDHRRESLLAQTTRVRDARLWTAILLFSGLVASAIWKDLGLALPVLIVGAIAFIWLLRKDTRLTRHTRDIQALRDFDARQVARLEGEIPPGVISLTTLGADINLTGPHSLFTLLDETFSTAGNDRLLSWITHAPTLVSVEAILLRQTQIRDLSKNIRFLKRLRLKAAASSELRIATSESERQLEAFAVMKAPFWQVALACILWTAWICVLIPFLFGVPGLGVWNVALLFIFAGFHSWARREIGSIFIPGEGLSHHLDALSPLFAHIENFPDMGVPVEMLTSHVRQHRPAHLAKNISRWLALLSVEGNPLVHILLMILTPWQLIASYGFLRKTQQLRAIFHPCLEELTEIEALSSLVFFYTYQTQTFAVVEPRGSLKFKSLYHPLLNRSRAVANSFEFHGTEQLGLITGSNMAGKSTFLRTVGLNQVLALMGAPVFAESMTTGFYRVETCIQVADSLRDGFSYFFAEVQRLSQLIKRATEGPPVLYLIDEIFRGTNNRERRIGSQAVIESLARTASLGFISTHDLELTEIASSPKMLGRIRNLHFKDDLEAGAMVFHYRIHEGRCPSTNALTIMTQAGLGPFTE